MKGINCMFDVNVEKNKDKKHRKPKYICNECGNLHGFKTIKYFAGDYDLECCTCGSTDIHEC